MALIILSGVYASSVVLVRVVGSGTYPNEAVVSASVGKTPSAAPIPSSPVVESGQAIKVIGNSDSRRYHLPGMRYYDRIDAHHRVEFSSEEGAIAAGYRKAPK
ncbi:MAG: hypothetical protein PHN75_11325 [Syntrophales bacterium]|nr:hypothetical protein [Syntrophales bacterium]